MKCHKCGSELPYGVKVCPKCGANPLEAQPKAEAEGAEQTQREPMRKSQLALAVVGGVVIAALAIAVFVLPQLLTGDSWNGTMTYGSKTQTIFSISSDINKFTIEDSGYKITGTLATTEETSYGDVYTLTDVDWGDWGDDTFRSDKMSARRIELIIPKGAGAENPYGTWSMVVYAYNSSKGKYYAKSTTVNLTLDGDGSYDTVTVSDVAESNSYVATPYSPLYNPEKYGTKTDFTWTKDENNVFTVTAGDDTNTLTFKD